MAAPPHRLWLVIPAGVKPQIVQFWDQYLDVGHGAATWTVGLNSSGDPKLPATHYWTSTALTDDELKTLAEGFGQAGGVTLPPTWETMTPPQRLDWVIATLTPLLQSGGITLVRDPQDGTWTTTDALLTPLHLKPLAAVP